MQVDAVDPGVATVVLDIGDKIILTNEEVCLRVLCRLIPHRTTVPSCAVGNVAVLQCFVEEVVDRPLVRRLIIVHARRSSATCLHEYFAHLCVASIYYGVRILHHSSSLPPPPRYPTPWKKQCRDVYLQSTSRWRAFRRTAHRIREEEQLVIFGCHLARW